ncbi:MAG: tRNA (adenosine(37)-N6)-threonylcarbamoyltransferase complex transferase subunit TsaD [Candidatus Delongbacteria bacterium]|nr:tRNA (adenosine(37)-N6)-threonylcarbamoyltransferase complex transferase subunit TsaD [Candidatus Delongbacteria bacterium]
MKILAIETSCDDTCAAVVEDGHKVLSNVISSQTEFHRKYGGVVPEIASRKHLLVIEQVIDEAMQKAETRPADIDLLAATAYHGLSGSLLVGMMAAKTLAYAWHKDFIPLNHIEGHIYANFIDHPDLEFPHLCLTVSGGHTILVLVKAHHRFEILGKTVDDAAGEAYDKVAQFLELGFPGGPIIDKLARNGNPDRYHLPRPMMNKDNFLFSFSGLKTAMLNLIRDHRQKGEELNMEDLCAGFQEALTDVLVRKTFRAAKHFGIPTVTLSGGVAANSRLRAKMAQAAERHHIRLVIPALPYCMDNAAMMGCLAYYRRQAGCRSNMQANVIANILLEDPDHPDIKS